MSTISINEIYREGVPFQLVKYLTILFIIISGAFLSFFIYQLTTAPTGNLPEITWHYLTMFIIFVGVSYVVAQIRQLNVIITTEFIKVNFGVFRYAIPWERVEGYRAYDKPGIKYSGGIHIGRVDGKSTLIYTVISCPVVTLELRSGRFRRFVFSTKYTDKVGTIIQRQIG